MNVLKIKCVVCGSCFVERAHIKTRGSGAGWEDWEYVYLCRKDHQEQGQIGILTFMKKYPKYKKALEEKGWLVENGKLINQLHKKS
jgi:hypothetical protein